MKRIVQRTALIVLGLMLGVGAWAGLESVTHISDLNSSWPLGSDLASTSDDHIRNIKVALKTDFPNINAAVTGTPTQLNNLTTNITFTGTVASAPGFSVSGSTVPANGIYLPSANTLGFAANTGAVGSMTSTVMTMPAFAVTGATLPTNGMYLPSANALAFASNGAGRASVGSTGSWSITAPTSGDAFTINGVSGSNVLVLNSASGQSLQTQLKTNGTLRGYIGAAAATDSLITGSVTGDLIFRGESTVNLLFSADAGTTAEFKILGTPALQGRGPVAAALVDMTPDKGTFTITYTGMTAGVTGTASWARMGNVVVLTLPAATGTSNLSTFTATGLPAAIQPGSLTQQVAVANCENTGTVGAVCQAQISSASGTITMLLAGASGGWTTSGVKGIAAASSITYSLL